MSRQFGTDDAKIAAYAEKTFHAEDELLKKIRENSKANKLPDIQVGSMDALHLEVLTRAFGVTKAVEIGTLGGYSGTAILRGLKPGGTLYTFDINEHNASVAAENFLHGGFSEQVEIFVGPALHMLTKIENKGPFDLVFIDADKPNYPHYLSWAAQHLRIGGVMLADNTFAFGMIAEGDIPEEKGSVEALRKFNLEAAQGGRFKATILPTGEGLTMAVKIK